MGVDGAEGAAGLAGPGVFPLFHHMLKFVGWAAPWMMRAPALQPAGGFHTARDPHGKQQWEPQWEQAGAPTFPSL